MALERRGESGLVVFLDHIFLHLRQFGCFHIPRSVSVVSFHGKFLQIILYIEHLNKSVYSSFCPYWSRFLLTSCQMEVNGRVLRFFNWNMKLSIEILLLHVNPADYSSEIKRQSSEVDMRTKRNFFSDFSPTKIFEFHETRYFQVTDFKTSKV